MEGDLLTAPRETEKIGDTQEDCGNDGVRVLLVQVARGCSCGALVCNPVLLVSVCFKLVMEFSGHVYAAGVHAGVSRIRS